MPHSHDHTHSHSHDHAHHHVPAHINKAFVIGIGLNMAIVLVEVIIGFWQHSLALLTDAGHNFSDVISLVFVLMAHRLSRLKPTANFTYGFAKSTVLAALANALLLLIAVGAIGWEAVSRFSEPHPMQGSIISIVAFVGLIVNAVTALLFFRDKERDINVKGAYLHMMADAAVSLGVIVAGIIISFTHWFWIDSVISIIIIIVIIGSSWNLLRDSIRLSLDGVPMDVEVQKIRDYFTNLTEVSGFHDLHIWAMSTTEAILTVHLVVPQGDTDALLAKVRHEMQHHFNVKHTTIQIEQSSVVAECEQKCEC